MAQQYDASTKYLVEARLADWLPLSGRPVVGRVETIEADLATVTAAADKVLRIGGPPAWLLNLELQANRDPDLAARLHLYNTLLGRRHGLPVWSMVLLLRREADAPELTGAWQCQFPGEAPYLTFRYQIVRAWETPADVFLNGGLGLVPLAPLAAVTEDALPQVIHRMHERIRAEGPPGEADVLWTAAAVLMGLRYSDERIEELFQGVQGMEESTFVQAMMRKGAIREAKAILLRQGTKRFGAPDAAAREALEAVRDLNQLERLGERLLDVTSWQDLLAEA